MCAAVPVALLLLVILAALTILRLPEPAPNALLLFRLLDAVGGCPEQDSRRDTPPPSTPGPIPTGKAGAV